jgi:hypothetical protein
MSYSIKNQIKLFWKYSEENRLDKFDFSRLFFEYRKRIYRKLAGHGQLDFSSYLYIIKKYYHFDKLKEFQYQSEHVLFKEDLNDILNNLFIKDIFILENSFLKTKNIKDLEKYIFHYLKKICLVLKK